MNGIDALAIAKGYTDKRLAPLLALIDSKRFAAWDDLSGAGDLNGSLAPSGQVWTVYAGSFTRQPTYVSVGDSAAGVAGIDLSGLSEFDAQVWGGNAAAVTRPHGVAHIKDASNYVVAELDYATLRIKQVIGGVETQLASLGISAASVFNRRSARLVRLVNEDTGTEMRYTAITEYGILKAAVTGDSYAALAGASSIGVMGKGVRLGGFVVRGGMYGFSL